MISNEEKISSPSHTLVFGSSQAKTPSLVEKVRNYLDSGISLMFELLIEIEEGLD